MFVGIAILPDDVLLGLPLPLFCMILLRIKYIIIEFYCTRHLLSDCMVDVLSQILQIFNIFA